MRQDTGEQPARRADLFAAGIVFLPFCGDGLPGAGNQGVAVGLAAYLLAYLISQSTLKRIAQLTSTMQAVENGNVAVRLEPSGEDASARVITSRPLLRDRR